MLFNVYYDGTEEVVDCVDLDEAYDYAYDKLVANYDGRSVDDIMEEEGVDQEEAENIYFDEIDSLDWWATSVEDDEEEIEEDEDIDDYLDEELVEE